MLSRIRNACPHALVESHGHYAKVNATIISPKGTINYICYQCHAVFYSNDVALHVIRKYGSQEGRQQWQEDRKKFIKLVKKEGFIV